MLSFTVLLDFIKQHLTPLNNEFKPSIKNKDCCCSHLGSYYSRHMRSLQSSLVIRPCCGISSVNCCEITPAGHYSIILKIEPFGHVLVLRTYVLAANFSNASLMIYFSISPAPASFRSIPVLNILLILPKPNLNTNII